MKSLPSQLQELTKEILIYQAPTTRMPYEEKLATFLETFLINLGFQTQRQPTDDLLSPPDYERFNVLAEKGNGADTLLVFAHLDTRPQLHSWISSRKPYFYLCERIYGPGTLSVKGGLIAFFNALTKIETFDFKLKIALLADGDGQQTGMKTLVKSDWLKNIKLAITPQPVYGQDIVHEAHHIIARTDNEFMKVDKHHQVVLNIEDYLKDYLNVSTIWHYPDDSTPESAILTQYATQQSTPFPIIGLGPQGEISNMGEWVDVHGIATMSNIFKFILQGDGFSLAT